MKTMARYGVVSLLGGALTWYFYLRADTIRARMHPTLNSFNVGLAYASLVLLGVTLAIGPVVRLASPRLGRLVPWRRQTGVVSGVLALAHVIVSAKVHLHWKWLEFFFISGDRRRGVDLRPYGIASWLGLVAVLLLVPLLVTSNDRAERFLGAKSWKWVQGHSYTVFALVAFHTAIYLNEAVRADARRSDFWREFWLVVVTVVALQWIAFWATVIRRRTRGAHRSSSPRQTFDESSIS